MSWGVIGLALGLVPWAIVFLAASVALPCRCTAATVLRGLRDAAVAAAVLASGAGLVSGEDPPAAAAGLVLAGVFGAVVFRSDPLGTTARVLPAAAVILAVGLWDTAGGGSPAGAPAGAVRSWLLPALTVFLAASAVYLRERVIPPFRLVLQRLGVNEPELYGAARAIPPLAVRAGAACAAVLAVAEHESWFRSALLLAVAVAVDVALALAVVICLSKMWRVYTAAPARGK